MCGKHSIKVCVCCFSQCPGISVPRVLIPDVIRGHSSLTRRICFKANFSFLIKLKSALTCIDLTCRLGTMTTMSVPPTPGESSTYIVPVSPFSKISNSQSE